jgi:plasmid stabilization system protein ParE
LAASSDIAKVLAPFRSGGTRRDDLIPGLRTVGYRKQATIAFSIEPDAVVIQGIFYGGQDYEAALRDDD